MRVGLLMLIRMAAIKAEDTAPSGQRPAIEPLPQPSLQARHGARQLRVFAPLRLEGQFRENLSAGVALQPQLRDAGQ